jgi:DNA ligase (NAD+)
MEADRETLEAVDEIGERIAQSVLDYLNDPRSKLLLNRLISYGLQFRMEARTEIISEILSGKSFVISGVFEHHSREKLKDLIEQHGGKNTGSISSKTDYILAGANMGPSKYAKAQKLDIPILKESEFIAMLH